MTTYVSSPMGLTAGSDAALQTYLSGYAAALDAVGMPRTNDTGQFIPELATLGTLPTGSAAETVYDVRYLNDALHATAPIILKTSLTYYYSAFRMNARIGTATDGAGTFVGNSQLVFADMLISASSTGVIGAVGGQGYAGIFPDIGGSGSKHSWMVCRTTTSGAPSSVGFTMTHWNSTGSVVTHVWCRRSTDAYSSSTDCPFCFVPGAITASHDPASALNVYRHWTDIGADGAQVNPWCVTVHAAEVSYGTTISAAPVTGDSHAFMPIPWWKGTSIQKSATECLAVRWE